MNETAAFAISGGIWGLVIVGIVVAGCILLGLKALSGAGKDDTIDCPECDGGRKRGWGPCPTSGPNDRIRRGHNKPHNLHR